MAKIVAAPKKRPKLEGRAIVLGEDRLAESYKFSINGYFYFTGMDFKLKKCDRIALLVPITRG